MGWETRNGRGHYYTRSRREGGRVVREYVGSGELAQALAFLEAYDREEAVQERQAAKAAQEKTLALDRAVRDFFGSVETILTTTLEAAGYHRHDRGAWRKRRGKTGGTTMATKTEAATKTEEMAKPAADRDATFRLLKRAQSGDEKTRPELQEWMATQGPSGLSPVKQLARDAVLRNMCGKNILLEEDAKHQMKALHKRLGGDTPSPLETLLVERIVVCWLHLHYYETIHAQGQKDFTLRQGEFHQRRIDQAHRRYLSAIKALAQVRRLQLPAVQVNIGQTQNIAEKQINVG